MGQEDVVLSGSEIERWFMKIDKGGGSHLVRHGIEIQEFEIRRVQ